MILGTSSGSSRSPFEDNSVIDVAALITGKDANNAARDVAFVKDRHPEVIQKLSDFRFPGQGQRKTAVTCAQGVVELVLLLPGRMAGRVRGQAKVTERQQRSTRMSSPGPSTMAS